MRSASNKSLRHLLGFALFALLPLAAFAQKAVFVVRHAEKEAPDRNEPSVPLSETGRARAERLASLLRDTGVTAIFATDTVRARSTAGPLSEALRQPIQTYSSVPALAEVLRKDPGTIALVVGHSNTVPEVLAALGVQTKVEVRDAEYDNLFLLLPQASGEPVLLRLRY